MPTKPLPEADLREAWQAMQLHGNKSHAAAALGLDRSTFQNRLKRAIEQFGPVAPAVELPELPPDDIPTDKIIERMCERFAVRHKRHRAEKWFPVKVNIDGPIGLTFFGDPHVDDDGCNWPLLRHHCELHGRTPALFGVNIGDTTNNWTGRLQRLFAHQETSQATAYKLAKWLLFESGIDWLIWLLGNHDMWNDGAEVFRQMSAQIVEMKREPWPDAPKQSEWQARFKLVFPNDRECRIWAAHNFPGYSQWNAMHGLLKAAKMKAPAHIFAAGHHHNWGLVQEESAAREFVFNLVRSRGYKFIDHHAEMLGHDPQQEGASVTAIIDPDSRTESGFVTCFADMDEAVDYLEFKRRKHAA